MTNTAMNATNDEARVQRVVDFFEHLTPQSVSQFGDYYTEDAYFKDPFNEVRGLPAVADIFSHMWDFVFRFKKFSPEVTQTVRGSSHLKFAADGRISFHRDYWDAAEELYEKLPVVGGVMRWLKARANS
jgi:steroid delta-isomerase